MDLREQRGMELAATRIITQKKGVWLVPSQSGSGKYQVNIMADKCSCTCPTIKHAASSASTSTL